MREKEIQDYLYEHPEVIFPESLVQEKAREYSIHGRRIDLLFVVDGIRYIVELKAIPLQRDHIGQVIEYYGLMKEYLNESNLRMIVVSPSIPSYRAKYLEELGIRCIQLPEVPKTPETVREISRISRANIQREQAAAELSSLIQAGDRFVWGEANGPASPRTAAIARQFLRDTLESVRRHFSEYEVVPYGITRGHSLDFDLEYDEASPQECGTPVPGGAWWAYRFGQSQDAPPNDVPNISIVAYPSGLDVTVNAEIQPSQLVVQGKVRSSPGRFDRIVRGHGGLWLKTYLKFEHQPRFYHWIAADCVPPGEFDCARILGCFSARARHFDKIRGQWLSRITSGNTELSKKQIEHLNRTNRTLNLAVRLVHPIGATDPFWSKPYKEQTQQVTEAIFRLKPLIDFFVEPS